jgi:hypothetical protein
LDQQQSERSVAKRQPEAAGDVEAIRRSTALVDEQWARLEDDDSIGQRKRYSLEFLLV